MAAKKPSGTGCYVSWATCDEWGRPLRWSKAHETYVDEWGQLETLCGARMPADADYGDEHTADGYCTRCHKINKSRREQAAAAEERPERR